VGSRGTCIGQQQHHPSVRRGGGEFHSDVEFT
jgi:hypothetical protein